MKNQGALMSVNCPRCKSHAGTKCRENGRNLRDNVHDARVELYRTTVHRDARKYRAQLAAEAAARAATSRAAS